MDHAKTYIQVIIMEIMREHRGKDRAITREALRDQVNHVLRHRCKADLVMEGKDDHHFRRHYVELPLCSGDGGLYIPMTPDEVAEFKRYIFSKIPGDQAALRVRRILATWPNLSETQGFEQHDLFEGKHGM